MEKIFDIWFDPEVFSVDQLRFINNLVFNLYKGEWNVVEHNTFQADINDDTEEIKISNDLGAITFLKIFSGHPLQNFRGRVNKEEFQNYDEVSDMLTDIDSKIQNLFVTYLTETTDK